MAPPMVHHPVAVRSSTSRVSKAPKPISAVSVAHSHPGSSKRHGKGTSAHAPSSSSGTGGGSHRSMGQTFKTNAANGTLSLSLPIDVSSGRSGFGPNLSLSYDSGSGNGPFGIGWTLSSNSITRRTSKQVPKYDESDVFILSGADDLVPVTTDDKTRIDDYTVRRYRPRVESTFLRIERWTNANDISDVFWRTINGENVTTYFGRSDTTRIFDIDAKGQKRIFTWLVSEMFDALGNSVHFEYKSENSAGLEKPEESQIFELHRTPSSRARMKYLKRIQYGNRTPNRDLDTWRPISSANLDFMFEVVLDYGEHNEDAPTAIEERDWNLRKDPFSSYNSGFEIRTYRLVQRILLFHHLAEKLGRKDYLVRSVALKYAESETRSILECIQFSGHVADGHSSYTKQDFASHAFEYTTVPSVNKLPLQHLEGSALQGLPGSNKFRTEWVDLDGEASPGILMLRDGAWVYQRNKMAIRPDGADAFGSARIVDCHPSLANGGDFYFEDLDRSGNMDLVYLNDSGRLDGYQERLNDGWATYENFKSVPSIAISKPTIKRMDLTGDGLQDILWAHEDTNQLFWQQCLAKEGFSKEKALHCMDSTPMLLSGDESTMVYLSDMSGDGMSDIVHVSNGRVSYWPNHGHGNFGQRIIMSSCPIMDSDDQFTHSRVRMIDIDGSGTTDMIYLMSGGGAKIYYNHCGNSWSLGKIVPNFPRVDNLSSVSVLDLCGNGTACLCWSGPSAIDPSGHGLFYLDLVRGTKPHLLSKYSNGLGLSTCVTYRSSTWFYQNDMLQGRPWDTKLSFPVPCVESVHQLDKVMQTATTTRYAYHDGYYDSLNREFCGFGMVEHWDAEEFDTSGTKPFLRPPSHTKSWFHTGAREIATTPSSAFSPPQLGPSKLPNNIHPDEYWEVCRALKGVELRTEIFSDDESEKASLPYQVIESRYTISRAQAPDFLKGIPGAYNLQPTEVLTSHYERELENPRQEHQLMLHINTYGDVTRSANIKYGRDNSLLPTAEDRANQMQSVFQYFETDYTNAIDEDYSSRKPQVSSERQYRIENYSWQGLVDFDVLIKDDCKILQSAPQVETEGAEPSTNLFKVLIKETRTEYLDEKLLDRLSTGILEEFSVVDQVFELTLTPGMLRQFYGNDDEIAGYKVPDLMEIGGYVEFNSNRCWWSPSKKSSFGDGNKDAQLQRARSSFYTPTVSIDQFGNKAYTTYDDVYLMIKSTTDAMGNKTSFTNNYIHLQQSQIIDLNGNRVQYCFDAFGNTVGVANLGKGEEQVGDSLENFKGVLSRVDLDRFIQSPLIEARSLLKDAAIRTIYSPEIYCPESLNQKLLPAFEAIISRDIHFRDGQAKLMITFRYLNGHGDLAQEVSLIDDKNGSLSWVISGWEVRDNKGAPAKIFQPSIAPSHLFLSQANMESPATIFFSDPLGRHIGSMYANSTWEKTEFDAWSHTFYDVGDTVLLDPSQDTVIGPSFQALTFTQPFSTWHTERVKRESSDVGTWDVDAAKKSSLYQDTPTIVHYDALGREILTVTDTGSSNNFSRYTYDDRGNRITETDAYNRLVARTGFDLQDRSIYSAGIDNGEKWEIVDCQGNEIFRWNTRGIRQRLVHDALRRQTGVHTRRKTLERLTSKICYGEALDPVGAARNNQRGEVVYIYDQSGIQCSAQFDFKGNCLHNFRQFAEDYKSILDWNTANIETPLLQEQKHHTRTVFNALNYAVESTNPKGHTTKRGLNLRGSLEDVSWRSSLTSPWQNLLVSITYTADNKPARVDYGNGTHVSNTYDKNTRDIINMRVWTDQGVVLKDITTTHDCLGRVTHIRDAAQGTSYFDGSVVDASNDYTYDSLGQLIYAEGREQYDSRNGGDSFQPYNSTKSFGRKILPSNGASMCRYAESYKYDKAGNIKKMQHEAVGGAKVSGWSREYSYDEPSLLGEGKKSNRLTSTKINNVEEIYVYGYNDNSAGTQGCMTSMPGYTSMTWNCEDMLRSSSTQINLEGTPETTWYVYDSHGKRVRKVTERAMTAENPTPRKMKDTLYLPELEIFSKFSGDGLTVNSETLTSHVVGVSRIALVEDGLVRYQVDQGLELDGQSNVVSYEEYSPFGSTTFIGCGKKINAPSKYRYASYERDNETGLYHCGRRYYASWLARWISPDPGGTIDGLNLYAYVSNDPVNFDDIQGTCKLPKINASQINSNNASTQKPESASKKSRGGFLANLYGKEMTRSTAIKENEGSTKSDQITKSIKPREIKRSATPNNKGRTLVAPEGRVGPQNRSTSSGKKHLNKVVTFNLSNLEQKVPKHNLEPKKIEGAPAEKKVEKLCLATPKKDRGSISDASEFFSSQKFGYEKKAIKKTEALNYEPNHSVELDEEMQVDLDKRNREIEILAAGISLGTAANNRGGDGGGGAGGAFDANLARVNGLIGVGSGGISIWQAFK
ncbi:hypothetical protein V499_03543 [Pseudogymnoascus sp. VKM F-103]|nr:hypothetical protein V499_03543 [Pseudogymnoascus sp. VKM F-103]